MYHITSDPTTDSSASRIVESWTLHKVDGPVKLIYEFHESSSGHEASVEWFQEYFNQVQTYIASRVRT